MGGELMKALYKVEDEITYCYVVAIVQPEKELRSSILGRDSVNEYFDGETMEADYVITRIADNEKVKISFDNGDELELTAKQWTVVYGTSHTFGEIIAQEVF